MFEDAWIVLHQGSLQGLRWPFFFRSRLADVIHSKAMARQTRKDLPGIGLIGPVQNTKIAASENDDLTGGVSGGDTHISDKKQEEVRD